MNNTHLEEHAQHIINTNKELFDTVKNISNDLLNNMDMTDINRYYTAQDKLTGIYGTLNTAYKELRSYKKNEEVKYYNQLKFAADANHEKFVSTVAEKQASYYVNPLRTARDILESYIDIITLTIDTCRSHIYQYQREKKYDI